MLDGHIEATLGLFCDVHVCCRIFSKSMYVRVSYSLIAAGTVQVKNVVSRILENPLELINNNSVNHYVSQ